MRLGDRLTWSRREGARFAGRLLVAGALASAAFAQDIGFEGPQLTGAGATPTESKPESKLWFNDGIWWGCLWSTSAQAFRIHRLNFTTHAWTDTGVAIEARSNSHSDALWDGTKLYIASHLFSSTGGTSGNPILVFRYSYNAATDAYSLDTGFPATIGDFSTEALVIAKDSTGVVWAAWTQGLRVRISHTLASDTQWSSSIVLPSNTTNLNVDDICSVTSYAGNRIGVLWSDQTVNAYRFSFHVDGAADTAWSAVENATTGETDDHLNLAVHSDGRVFVAGKNAGNNLLLLVRATNGTWSRFVITQPTPILTRPIVLLDEPGDLIRIFATGQDSGEVFEKTSPISSISFGTGTGTIRMRDSSTVFRISNPTSTKQNIDASTGLVVLAHHDTTGFYWHHDVAPIPPVANFTATPTSGAAPLTVDFTDASTGSITSRSWSFGDGGTSTATSPSHVYTAAGTYTVSLTVTGPGGSDTETKTNFITVQTSPPVADFSASPTSGQAPLAVGFTDASTGSISSRSWSFGDGGTSTATNPSHTYAAAGSYTVSLTVTGPGGSDTETKTDFIVVSTSTQPPVADFGAAPTSGEAPLTVAFTDSSTGSITSRSWSFGDGGTSSSTNPGHTYAAAGTYTVSLTVSGPGGSDTETKTDLIDVSEPGAPVADFGASPTSGEAPLAVQFTDASTGSVTSWSWDFGDGGSSTAQNPAHCYIMEGTFTVSLTVTGPGGTDGVTKVDLIVVTPPPPIQTLLPVADARVNEGSPSSNAGTATELRVRFATGGSYNSYLRFDLTGVTQPVVSAKLRLFCTDDSPVGGLVFPTSNGWTETGITWANKPAATGGQIGSLGAVPIDTWVEVDLTGVTGGGLVSFLMTSTSSNSALYSSREGTNPPELVIEIVPPTAPVAAFSASPLSGTAPLAVGFTDASTGSITSRSWSFGDGGTSTATDPSHTYTAAGSYTVSLTVAGPDGSDTETKTDYIVVSAPAAPAADFTATPTSGAAPLQVSFTDASTGTITSRSWSFGDGGTSTATSPSHTYSAAGTYTVSLTVSGPGGMDSETKTDFIVVSAPPPVAGFSASPTSGEAPLQVSFTDASTGSITSRSWSFGDGGTSTATSPSHTYTAAGTYTVSLTVNGPGGSDTETKTDLIVVSAPPAPVADFTAAPTSGVAPLNVAFTDTSTGSVTSRLWDFGDGSTSTAQNPSHVFGVGTFTVSLTVTGPGGTDDLTQVDLIHVTAPQGSVTLQPVADARVGEASPGSNYGTMPELRVRLAAGGTVDTYLRFDLTGVGSVVSAKLRLYCMDESPVGGLVFPTSSGWSETGINWNNKPAATGGQIASVGAVATNTWAEVDVTPAVTGGGPVSLLLTSTSSNAALYASREAANRPELVVVVGAAVPPVAEFSASPLSGQAPLSVVFTDLSTGSPTSWSWDFGDGGNSSQGNPTHVFTTPGSYSVTLEVSNAAGSSQVTKTDLVAVSPAPPVQVLLPVADARVGEASPGSNYGTSSELRVRSAAGGSVDTYLRFDLTGVGSVASAKLRLFCTDESPVGGLVFPTSSGWSETGINWNNKPAATGAQVASLGPVTTGSWIEFDVSSAVPGGGLVSFLLTSTSSNSALYASRETVNRPELVVVTGSPTTPPVAGFSASPLSGSAPLTVSFTDTSTGGPTGWSWDFGDGATSSVQNPTHVYTVQGLYTVTLVASNPGGSSSVTKTDLLEVGPASPIQTFLAVADARVNEGSPSSNAGTATELRVRSEVGGSYNSYLRFDLTGLAGAVTSAKLRLFCTDGSPVGGVFFPTSNVWTETGINWTNKPAATGGQVASLGTVATGAWVEVDVTSAIGAGVVDFLITSTSTNSALYSSREGTNRPELVVTTGSP